VERRELLRWLAVTVGLECLEGLAPGDIVALGRAVHARGGPHRAFEVLGPHAQRTVVAAAERMLPATETPGATDAGVVAFIDRMLADWYTPAERDRFTAGLPDLDARCRALRGTDFVTCDDADQEAVLIALDDEVTALRRSSGTGANDHWFAMLKYLTVWGYCTSEVGMRETLRTYPLAMRYDGCAPVARGRGGP